MADRKRCSRCGTTKHLAEFSANKSQRDGLQNQCKQCNHEVYLEHREQKIASVKSYRLLHLEHLMERRARRYREHREQALEYSARWAREHPDYRREANRKWARAHPDVVNSKTQRHRAKKRGNGGSFTTAEWEDLLEFYNYHCLCCGRDDLPLTVDHILPVAMGGTSFIDNIQPLCKSCNSRKGIQYIDYRTQEK